MKVTKPLGELVEFMRNGTTAEQNQDGVGYPVTRIETISQGVVDSNRVRFVNLTGNELVKWKLQVGDILFSHINSEEHIGKSALYEGQPTDLVHGMNLLLLRPAQDQVLPSILHYFLRSPQARSYVRARCKKAINQASINQKELGAMEAIAPPLAEQAKVVDLLTRAEGIVRLRREAAAKASELIPALFIHHFGDPATNPMGWPVVELGSLLDEPPTLGTMKKPTAEPQPWLDLRVANIQGGRLHLYDQKWLDLTEDEAARFSLRRGDIVLARAIGSLDHLGKAVVVEPSGQWAFDSHLMRVRLDQRHLLPEVLKTYLETAAGRREFLSHTRRSAVQFNINGKELRRLTLPLPPMVRQRDFLRQVEASVSIENQQTTALAKAQSTFEALLAQAFAPA